MALFVNSNQTAAQQHVVNNNTIEDKYSNMVYLLNCVRRHIEDGVTISKLKEMNDSNAICKFNNGSRFPDSRTIDKCIGVISSDIGMTTFTEDKLLYDAMNEVIKKYGLKDMNQLIAKLKEFEMNSDAMYNLANLINSVVPNQITDTQSLVTYVTELVKNTASVQNNANSMFLNLNAAINENAVLKAQIQNYKQQLTSLGVSC